MEARKMRVAIAALAVCLLGASHRTPNFVVKAPSEDFARQVGQAAEDFRRDLAIRWLGKELPRWASPCPITLQVGPHLGAGGATSFVFDHGEVFNWQMQIQGSPERIVDSVLPHEITHTIFASHFRRPLPRWADEGACTTVEHNSERGKMSRMLIDFLQTGRGIAFNELFVMRDYPEDVMPLYSQGYSLCRFLIEQGGPRKFVAFIGDGMNGDRWTEAVNSHYGFTNLGQLQNAWVEWVRQGSPSLQDQSPEQENPGVTLASATQPGKSPATATAIASAAGSSQPEPIYRAQSADTPTPVTPAPATAVAQVASVVPTPIASTAAPASRVASIPANVGPQAIAATSAAEHAMSADVTDPTSATNIASATRGTPGWRSRGWRSSEEATGPGPVASVEEHNPAATAVEPAPRDAAPATSKAQPPRRVLLEWTRPSGSGQRVAANRPVAPPLPLPVRDREAEMESNVRPLYFDAPLGRTLLR
jgi:hypothetical protein